MVKKFTDLEIYQLSNKLTLKVYKLVESFPVKEKFCLVDQLIRASSSIGANIAEGFGRYHTKEYIKFLYIARGSLMEVLHFLILAKDLNYLSQSDFIDYDDEINRIAVKINNLIGALSKQQIARNPHKSQGVANER